MPDTPRRPSANSDQLDSLIHRLAEQHVPTERKQRRSPILRRLDALETALRAAHRHFAQTPDVEIAVSYGVEWLLDNFYLVEQTLRQVREAMPPGYYRQLPKLETPSTDEWPRVYALAREIIGYYESHLDPDRVARFVEAYQRVRPLTMGEIWALPTMLRIVAIENLTWAVIDIDPEALGERIDVASLGQSQGELDSDTVISNTIRSLRRLAVHDWKAFFERVSLTERLLRQDPSGVYAGMDFETRDLYRGEVERLALATGIDEREVATAALELAGVAGEGSVGGRQAHVGYYLVGEGIGALEARIGYQPSVGKAFARWWLDHPTLGYLGSVGLTTALVLASMVLYALAAGGAWWQTLLVGVVGLVPSNTIAVYLVNWLATRSVPPRPFPRMDFRDGIPDDCRTMLVVPALLTSRREVDDLLGQMELHFLRNADPNLTFALLADLGDAPEKHMPGDQPLIDRAREGIKSLNRSYGQEGRASFYFLYRERAWNPAEDCWMGWERKRGKLVELNRLLMGREHAFSVRVGDFSTLPAIRYVITLDADTVLPRDGARRLIAAMAHPLNQPVFDPQTGDVVAGYTVLQPRVEIGPAQAGRSLFARVFSGDTGIDLYTRAVSDVYQDIFGEGIYAGKGIYDVAAFDRSLDDRVPENHLLSHDLFEGIHGRAGLLTDVILYEDYPSHYLAYTRRLHRWVRGDWQLLPWLAARVPSESGKWVPNRLSVIDRWKTLDNLRRSLVSPTLLLFFVLAWLVWPGSAVVWTLIGGLVLVTPVITSLLGALLARTQEDQADGQMYPVRMALYRAGLAGVFLPYESLIMLDAISCTLYRMGVSRKRLLQWTTAAHTFRMFGRWTRVGILWQQMWHASFVALLVSVLVAMVGDAGAVLVSTPFLFWWILSPYVAHWISRPVVEGRTAPAGDERARLRRLARRTWLYFERFVGPDEQWLPPDHFQEEPLGLVAHRTSPTNIGLHLLATLAAFDLGYIGPLDFMLRLRPTLKTMGELERHRGHFLNWYDTRTLRPLPPRYVSVVDSGNLAACLLILKEGAREMSELSAFRWARWRGVLDAIDVLSETIVAVTEERALKRVSSELLGYLGHMRRRIVGVERDPRQWATLLQELADSRLKRLEQLVRELIEAGAGRLEVATLRDMRIWLDRLIYQVQAIQTELDMLYPWVGPIAAPPVYFDRDVLPPKILQAWRALNEALPLVPPLSEVAQVCQAGREEAKRLRALLADETGPADQLEEARAWCDQLIEELYSARMAVESVLIGFQDLQNQAETYFQEMTFNFLFDPQRQVFHIGYNLETGALDANYYDLVASEARIASLLAIAKGDVPQTHWMHLSRSVTRVDGRRALLSWGGTMFEYLMPALFLRTPEKTLLGQSVTGAVERQIEYAQQQGVPWGVSESGYYRFDAGQHYQYRGFGVPGLGFKRGLGDDLVIAPYASILALSVDPQAVLTNLDRLVDRGMMGRYGFYEAMDFTASRLPADQNEAIVRSYMVHHHGMSLLALDNYLNAEAMVRRLHADPRIQSIELLLHEQVPYHAPIETPHPKEGEVTRKIVSRVRLEPWEVPAHSPTPHVHLLSNDQYSLWLTNAGGGQARYASPDETISLTRWRADPTLDSWGVWLYVKDLADGALWSATRAPVAAVGASYQVEYDLHQVQYTSLCRDISARMEVTVSPERPVEIRRMTLVNQGNRTRRLMVTSYGEVVLAAQEADRRHPAFVKLFVESEYVDRLNALLFRRRPRSDEDPPVFMAHLLVLRGGEPTSTYETDRAEFIGRTGSVRAPRALRPDEPILSGTTGATLDPIMSIGQVVELKPHAQAQLAYVTLVADSRELALDLAEAYQSWSWIRREFDAAHVYNERQLRRLNLSTSDLKWIQELLSLLLYPQRALRASSSMVAANRKGQPGLWSYGISGDYPVLLVRVADDDELVLVGELLQAHAYWRYHQVKIDLVIVNHHDTAYDQALQEQLYRLVARSHSDDWLNQRGGIFILRADQVEKTDRILLSTVARAILDGGKGTLAEQLDRQRRRFTPLPLLFPTPAQAPEEPPIAPVARPDDLQFDNGLGGFTPDGREYVIYVDRQYDGTQHLPPRPWINVIANRHFGFTVSEVGSGFTWALNSGENRLTPWRNDPVTDPPSEVVYLRDEETGQVWTPTPAPSPADGPYLVRHGAGYSTFHHHSHGLKQRLRLFAAPDAPVKLVQLRLENAWDRPRRITVTFYVEWVLGTNRDVMQQYVVPTYDADREAILARNTYHTEFGSRVAFVAAGQPLHGLTADRAEFLGPRGSYAAPEALRRIGLASRVEPALDPCAALQVHLELAAGETRSTHFLLGQGADRAETLGLIDRHRQPDVVRAAWEGATGMWDEILGQVTVRTPDPAMDLMLNRWLLYQALSCRVWGRSALYQSSGAFGFRDQLQDVMALVHARPDLVRAHILDSARHQFEAGDVLHWWHPPSGRGVRTRCSDDLLWLPFVVAHYVETTGDESILAEQVPYLKAEPLKRDELERYGAYAHGEDSGSLYDHCRRAIERGSTRGPHDLPLIGSHDWNDGLNRVGLKGKGESVWLGWFLYDTLQRFSRIGERMDERTYARRLRRRARDLGQALESHGWCWGWYFRGYYDDGTPLGSPKSEEAQIDSLAQSWAVLSGAARQDRARQAMKSVNRRLVRRGDQLILIFTPPFDQTERDPGYIKGYPPGIRENGGQYTHAALWTIWAFAEVGQGDRAGELFRMLNPIHHADSLLDANRYQAEPYVVAADVYSVEPHVGEGGWTWYTGSAGWMYRLGLERILGLQREGDRLRIRPCIPKKWHGYQIIYRYGKSVYHIHVENVSRVSCGVSVVLVDGDPLPDEWIELRDDGQRHEVHVLLGQTFDDF